MQRWLATAAPGQIGGVTVNAAAAHRAEKTRREGVARQILTAELRIPLTTGAGRPSADLILKREQLAALVTAYGAGDGPRFALCGECSVLAQGGRNVKEYEIEIEGGGLSHTN